MHTTKRFLLLTSCAWCIAFTQAARADYFGLEVLDRTDLTICQDTTESYIPYKMNVCDLHIVFNNSADRVISVAFSNVSTTAQQGFFQHTLGGNTAPACGMIPLFPTLECDSFITLGLECDRGGSTTDPDFDSVGFNTSGEVNGGWYNSAPSNGQGAPDANGRVMIARFSYKQNKTANGDTCIFTRPAGSQEIVAFLLQPFDCDVPGGGLPTGDGESTFCGDEDAGNCFEDNSGTAYCNCAECCDLVCGIDPFCCDTECTGWDGQCGGQACDLCSVNRCQDCDGNGTPDGDDIDSGRHADCNANGIPDVCEIDQTQGDPGEFFCTQGVCIADCDACFPASGCEWECIVICDPDCNGNGIPDECDLASGTSVDCDCNGNPGDCNFNEVLDSVDIADGTSLDCNSNGIPDECDLAVPGPMMLCGEDADAPGHCPAAGDCGRLYPALFEWALANSRITPVDPDTPIVAIGVNGGQAQLALDAWVAAIQPGPPPSVEFVTDTTTPSIWDVNFADFAVVYIPSTLVETNGGITPVQLEMLNARQQDIEEFVNFLGGGLIALTEAGATSPSGEPNAYGWLPICLEIADVGHDLVCPTQALSEIPDQTATCGNMSHPGEPMYHNIFTGPPGFYGLSVLAVDNEEPIEEQDAVLLGQLDFVAELDCDGNGEIDECQCPTDVDGDGNTGAFDLAVLLGCWGALPGIPQCNCLMDADADGMIGPFDLAFLLGAWGPCP